MMPEKSTSIAVFSFAYEPFEGGAEIAIREIVHRLPMFRFTVLTARFSPMSIADEAKENVRIVRLGSPTKRRYGLLFKKIGYVFRAWRAAEALHAQERFEAIWVVMASYGGIAALLFKMNHPRIPMLVTLQEGDSEKHLTRGKLGLVGLFGRLLIRNAEYIQVISGYLRDFALMQGAQVPIEIVPNGVDEELFATEYTDAQKKALREYLDIKDEYVVLTTSRLVRKNGVDILINAVAEFAEKNPLIKCIIAGGGPERKRLEKLIRKRGLEGKVVLAGQVAQHDLPLYFAVADIFVRASRSEGLGSSFLEAMAAGVPVIGTPVGGIVDFLKDGETGFVARPEDPHGVALKMAEILENRKQTDHVVRQAQALIHRNYSWETVARMMRNIFDKLINL
ncbi:MAG: glycosyltransferase family 4 protein [Patescibacteria group bacterium]|nr:glycosyltransferase family 4 protein [Patescibacteria group bacterium]